MKTQQFHPKIEDFRLRYGSRPVLQSQQSGADFKIRAAEDGKDDRLIKGYLSVFGVPEDEYGTIPMKGCFQRSIEERGPESGAKNKIIFLWNHRPDEPIGQFTVLKEDDYGLYFEARMDEVPQAERALIQVRSGTINQFSYGFRYVWDKMIYDEEIDKVRMFDCKMFEGSTAPILAANSETFAIRSLVSYQNLVEDLEYQTEEFIKSVPRSKQLELRQLISQHIALNKIDVDTLEKRTNPVESKKGDKTLAEAAGYNLNFNEF